MPGLTRPSSRASQSAKGIEAAEVLAYLINRNNHFFHGKVKSFCQGLDNSNIGLMGNKQIYIFSA